MKVMLTGGAGYIGSHATRALIAAGHRVLVVDNLSRGHRAAIHASAEFVQADVGDEKKMLSLLQEHRIEAVLHFAANIEVGESVLEPIQYYQNNFAAPLKLLSAVRASGVKKFVFSSTAAVYGLPERFPIVETDPLMPINPYGRSKMMMELALADACHAYGLGYCALRYFNVAGAHPDSTIGEDHHPETHLIPRLLKAALEDGAKASIFGTDYETPDGTCVRDYVHVVDLAQAHLLALEALQPGQALIYNLGSEVGFSVREVIAACERVIGRKIPTELGPRRAGDPATLVASSRKISAELSWKREFGTLEKMIEDAWNWHRKNPLGYNDAMSVSSQV
jgi:UDP-glucose 4-epimerase